MVSSSTARFNVHLFQLINAPAGLSDTQILLPMLVAQWLILGVPVALLLAWHFSGREARQELLHLVLAMCASLAVAQVIGQVCPQPRPFALHLGHQYLSHVDDAGLPSDHVTVFWGLAVAALRARHFAVWGFPLLAAGLWVGWSRVFLGVHFPMDVLAALPTAVLGLLLAGLGGRLVRRFGPMLHDRYEAWHSHWH